MSVKPGVTGPEALRDRVERDGPDEVAAADLDQRAAEEHADDAALGQQVKRLVDAHGGAAHLREECVAIACYNDNNYLPLLWRFYRSHRPTLFRLARSLAIHSTIGATSKCVSSHPWPPS